MYAQRSVLPVYIYTTLAIKSCDFDPLPLFLAIPWYQAFIIFGLFIFGEIITFLLNKQTGYDTIKYIGAPDCNLFDNILIRLIGVYLF